MGTPGTIGIGEYLIQALRFRGVDHVFGVPGDFILTFFDQLERSDLTVVNTCDEQGAGFAADAYARIRGLGVVCVTYGVGGLKVVNSTGQAFAEESPVVVICGAPSLDERIRHPYLHHKVQTYDTQRLVYDQITVASTVLSDPETACQEIDRVLDAAIEQSRPVYIELPRDMVLVEAPYRATRRRSPAQSDSDTLRAALHETTTMIVNAKQPVVLLGVEVHRFGLLAESLAFIERTNLPTAVTLLDKSAIREDHPCFIGLYGGRMGRPEVSDFVESSDCVIMLGTVLTDVNLGGFTAKLDPKCCIHAARDRMAIGYHTFEHVRLADFVAGLAEVEIGSRPLPSIALQMSNEPPSPASPNDPITVTALFARLATFLTAESIVLADPGDALFGSADLPIPRPGGFLAPAYYASLGFAVPASIGAQLAAPDSRPVVLVGDGAFQMTGLELSTSARYGLNPIVVVLNNAGYVTERLMIDGAFNDVLPWNYNLVPDLLGAGLGFVVRTADDLDEALAAAAGNTGSFSILDVRLDPEDVSPALRRMTERLGMAAKEGAVALG